MTAEMLARCDENGNVIGSIERNEAHKTGCWHKSVHIYVVNDNKEVLLQLRSHNKDILPDMWDVSVGGHVDAGENSRATAKRETKEEIGISANEEDFKYLFTTKEVITYNDFISREFVDIFLLHKNLKAEEIVYQKEELADIAFIPLQTFFDRIENHNKTLIAHDEEYTKLIPILKQTYSL